MWDMEVLLVLRLCCNCTYGNNSAALVCLETLLCSFSSVILTGLSLWSCQSGVLSVQDASTCDLVFSVRVRCLLASTRMCKVPLEHRSLCLVRL